jgi:CheY-specific phosphatase CheX
MTITHINLCQLTRAIWESTLGLEVRPIPVPVLSEQQGGIVTGRVQITGAWLGAVLLECSEELAKKVACTMFGLDSEPPTSEEVRDALAEITSVTAGNFKPLVCGNCQLSMPQVTHDVLDPPISPHNVVISRQAFACQGKRFVVTILAGQVNS